MYYRQNAYHPLDIRSIDGAGDDDDGIELSPWDQYVRPGFGNLVNQLGFIDEPVGLHVEVHDDDDLGDGTFRTPIIELSGDDYEYFKTVGVPYDGMIGISDLGDIYQYSHYGFGLGGLFKRIGRGLKKLAKKAKKRVKKIKKGIKKIKRAVGPKRILSLGKKILSKTKLGRTALKIGGKILKTTMKIVKPLAKQVGKWAPRLAPIAALVPGVGPAIMGGMLAAGRIAKMVNKYGGKIENTLVMDKKSGKTQVVKKLNISPQNQKRLKASLESEARKFSRKPSGQIRRMLRDLKHKPPEQYARPLKPIPRSTIETAANVRRDIVAKQNQIASLVKQLERLGYPVERR